MSVWRSFGLVVLVTSLLLAACGGDDPSPEEAQADLCEDLGSLESALSSLVGLGGDATIEDVEDQRDEVRDAYDDVVDSANDVEDAEVDSLEQAYDDLDQAVDDIGDDMTIADALASLEEEIATVQTAWTDLLTATECP